MPTTDKEPVHVVIMAGGLGKRMKSELPKVLHPVGGLPMLSRVIKTALRLEHTEYSYVVSSVHVIAGKYKSVIEETLQRTLTQDEYARIAYAIQEEALGTGHAVRCALPYLMDRPEKDRVLVLSGDVPLMTTETLHNMLSAYDSVPECQFTLLLNSPEDPTGCGRVLMDPITKTFERIVEEKDATDEQKKIRLANCGIYVFNLGALRKELPRVNNDNAQKEYYLPDVLPFIQQTYKERDGNTAPVTIHHLDSENDYQVMNINNREQLSKAEEIFQEKEHTD